MGRKQNKKKNTGAMTADQVDSVSAAARATQGLDIVSDVSQTT